LDVIAKNEDDFVMYPNPSSGIVNFRLLPEEGFDLEVYDAQGKSLFSLNHQPASLALDFSNYPKGIYLVRMTKDELVLTKKLIIN
ncbi:MAG TPA: T9SS type A sorting domain-containing protein, partial [Bacteroidia bacterium]|nr:T9SS type A sorting domain-containing protein [Bacteroidia bacterium]